MSDQSLTQASGCTCDGVGLDQDQTMAMLCEAGVEGAAAVAVHEILVPCSPDERCVDEVRHAVLRAADRLVGVLGTNRDSAVRPLAALLSLLESMPGQTPGVVADEMASCCSNRCQRPAPRGRRYQKALISARDALIDARHGWSLVLQAESGTCEPMLRVELADPENDRQTVILHADDVAVLGSFASRLQRLSQLVIVKKLGPNFGPPSNRRGPLRVSGLRIHGRTQAWSDFHNAIDRAPVFGRSGRL